MQAENTLCEEYFDFFEKFKEKYESELDNLNIGILDEFINNKFYIEKFHGRYVENKKGKIILCGINPGRFGAGKTGIPFIDFSSLSKIFPEVDKDEKEKSASFMFSIIESIGIDKFYEKFHITNLSWYGFYDKTSKKNINFYQLPSHIANFLLDKFVEEVKYLESETIIPISNNVLWELELNLKKNGKLNSVIESRLYHPSTKFAKKEDYLSMIKKYI